jgi:hypothetical protein
MVCREDMQIRPCVMSHEKFYSSVFVTGVGVVQPYNDWLTNQDYHSLDVIEKNR